MLPLTHSPWISDNWLEAWGWPEPRGQEGWVSGFSCLSDFPKDPFHRLVISEQERLLVHTFWERCECYNLTVPFVVKVTESQDRSGRAVPSRAADSLSFPLYSMHFGHWTLAWEEASSGRRINASELRRPPRQALPRQGRECVLGKTGTDCRDWRKEEGPGRKRGDDDDFRWACSESANVLLSEQLQHGNCKWPLNFSNCG